MSARLISRWSATALVLVAALLASSAAAGDVWQPREADVLAWMSAHEQRVTGQESTMAMWTKFLGAANHWVREELETRGVAAWDRKAPFGAPGNEKDRAARAWDIFPVELGAVVPDQESDTIIVGGCFTYTGRADTQEDGSTLLTLDAAANADAGDDCTEDYLLLATMTAYGGEGNGLYGHQPVTEEGTLEFTWVLPDDATDGEVWDLATKGIRLYRWRYDPTELLQNVFDTLLLFMPETGAVEVKEVWEQLNIDFMEAHTEFVYDSRDPDSNIVLTPDDIQSGDLFGTLRQDGLSPMIAWASGATTGHAAAALELGGEMYVTESTVASNYWPVDGVQKTPFDQWVSQVQAADFAVVHMPLTDAARANYNLTAAQEFFLSVEGLEYGFLNFLLSWLDVGADNMPVLPPTYDESNWLSWDYWTTMMGSLDRAVPGLADQFWLQPLNLRLGTEDLRTADAFYEADKQGMTISDLIGMPELDSYEYETTRYGEPAVGRSMVCSVYACSSVKAAGVFGDLTDDINCGEMSTYDIFSLDIVSKDTAQISGRFTLDINEIGSKTPYAGVSNACPTKQPDYPGREHC